MDISRPARYADRSENLSFTEYSEAEAVIETWRGVTAESFMALHGAQFRVR